MWTGVEDNHTPRALLQRLIESGSEDALITRAPCGKPCRGSHSDWGCSDTYPVRRHRCACCCTGADRRHVASAHAFDDARLI
jgi:hypothetical protein